MKSKIENIAIFCNIIANKFLAYFSAGVGSSADILIIKADVIGDYVVFRNYLENFKRSPKYKNRKITLLANVLLKDLATMLDGGMVDEFLWVDYRQYDQFSYKRSFFSALSKRKFEEVAVFHYSRTLFTDVAAFAANAKRKFAMANDYLWVSAKMRRFTDKFYSTLVWVPENCTHEFAKNGYFASQLTGIATWPDKKLPVIALKDTFRIKRELAITGEYVVVSSGAGEPKRRLPYSKLLTVVEKLFTQGYRVCFIGTPADADFVTFVKENNPARINKIIDFAGKTTLPEMLHIVKHAKLVICNESSVYHIAVALQKPVACMAGGGHYKRWADYGIVENVRLAYHTMPCFNCDWRCVYTITPGHAYPCIQSIEDSTVARAVEYFVG